MRNKKSTSITNRRIDVANDELNTARESRLLMDEWVMIKARNAREKHAAEKERQAIQLKYEMREKESVEIMADLKLRTETAELHTQRVNQYSVSDDDNAQSGGMNMTDSCRMSC